MVRMNLFLAWISGVILFISLPTIEVDHEIAPYYNEFMEIVKNECPNLQLPNQLFVLFDELNDDEIGSCTVYLHKKQILIDKNFWSISEARVRKQLVFHELTHCVLKLNHVDVENNYMYPYIETVPGDQLIEQVRLNVRIACEQR